MSEPTGEDVFEGLGIRPEDVHVVEKTVDNVLVQDITSPKLRVTFIRLEEGTRPVNTLRGECHVDVAADGRILGVTVELRP